MMLQPGAGVERGPFEASARHSLVLCAGLLAVGALVVAACAEPRATASDDGLQEPPAGATTLETSSPPTQGGQDMVSTTSAVQGDSPPPDAPHVSPFVRVSVTDVAWRLMDSGEVELTVLGTLPDLCMYEFVVVETRDSGAVRILLDAIHPPDPCETAIQEIEYSLMLGRDLPEEQRALVAGSYTLRVNDFETVLEIPGE